MQNLLTVPMVNSVTSPKPSSGHGSFRDSQRSKRTKAPTILVEILDTVSAAENDDQLQNYNDIIDDVYNRQRHQVKSNLTQLSGPLQ